MRKPKRVANEGSQVITKSGLPEPFPAPPSRQTLHAVYCKYPADAEPGQSRIVIMTFAANYSARHFIDRMLGHQGFKWLPANKALGYDVPDTIVGENNVELRCAGMEELIEHEFTKEEAAWELPEQYERQCVLIRRAYSEDDEVGEDGEAVPKKAKREKREKVERPKVDRSGLVTVGEIAKAMGIEPRDARGALRKQKTEKPNVGWAWPADQVEAVKGVIKAGLK